MTSTPPTPAAAPPPSISCTRCGYDLRGLSRDSRCPECGTPLLQSLYGDYLRHQQPAWLRSLVRGAVFSVAAQAGWLALSGYWLARHGSYDWNVMVASPVAGVALPLALAIVNLTAVALLTRPLPQQAERFASSRRLLRVGAGVMAAMSVAGYMPALREPPAALFWVPFGVTQALTSVVGGIYLATVAMRVPNKWLALETLVAAATTALLEAALYVYPWTGFRTVCFGVQVRGLPVGPAQIALWVLGSYMLVLTLRYYLALAAALETAAAAAAELPDA